MSSPLIHKKNEATPSNSVRSVESFLCQQCGGNGYMKSNPNCYHTCLNCLGRGLVHENS